MCLCVCACVCLCVLRWEEELQKIKTNAPQSAPSPNHPLGWAGGCAFISSPQPVPCLLTPGPSAQYSLIHQWSQGHGKLGLLSLPCPNKGRRPLGNKTATTTEKK